mmetsp:Transcript_6971/g.15260  ORF Transcript_6971/g.15260 Transcript_6971/m.15260 type:complete len:611 (-) Transcript_6971:25-1857(-)
MVDLTAMDYLLKKAMEDLLPNPEGCTKFVPNPFKKEKCKDCALSWEYHKGAITEAEVRGFIEAKQKVADTKAKAEAEAKAKARAKKEAQKKKEQAVEDDWLMDAGAQADQGFESDASDDKGFQMFVAADFQDRPAMPAKPKELKVRNLIDFSECDVAEEMPSSAREPEPIAPAAAAVRRNTTPTPTSVSFPVVSHPSAVSSSSSAAFPSMPERPGPDAEELERELQHLRQMLAQANEVKAIELDIIRDEVTEKQAIVDELQGKNAKLEAEMTSMKARMQELEERGDSAAASAAAPPAAAAATVADTQEVDALKEKLVAVEEELRNSQSRVSQLEAVQQSKGSAEEAAAAAAALGSAPAAEEVEELRRKLATAEEELSKMQAKAAEAAQQVAVPDVDSKQQQQQQQDVEDLRHKLASVEAELSSSQARVLELEERSSAQLKATAAAEGDVAAWQQKLAKLEAELTMSQARIRELEERSLPTTAAPLVDSVAAIAADAAKALPQEMLDRFMQASRELDAAYLQSLATPPKAETQSQPLTVPQTKSVGAVASSTPVVQGSPKRADDVEAAAKAVRQMRQQLQAQFNFLLRGQKVHNQPLDRMDQGLSLQAMAA